MTTKHTLTVYCRCKNRKRLARFSLAGSAGLRIERFYEPRPSSKPVGKPTTRTDTFAADGRLCLLPHCASCGDIWARLDVELCNQIRTIAAGNKNATRTAAASWPATGADDQHSDTSAEKAERDRQITEAHAWARTTVD